MWHCSATPLPVHGRPRKAHERDLRRIVLRHLAGVGDRSAEWVDWKGVVYHLRRRLTPDEARSVGAVLDLRGTAEGWARYNRLRPYLIPVAAELAREEMGPEPKGVES